MSPILASPRPKSSKIYEIRQNQTKLLKFECHSTADVPLSGVPLSHRGATVEVAGNTVNTRVGSVVMLQLNPVEPPLSFHWALFLPILPTRTQNRPNITEIHHRSSHERLSEGAAERPLRGGWGWTRHHWAQVGPTGLLGAPCGLTIKFGHKTPPLSGEIVCLLTIATAIRSPQDLRGNGA